MVAIFVLSLFFFVLLVDWVVLRVQGKDHPAFVPSLAQLEFPIIEGNYSTVPSNIFFSKGHTWLKKNKEGLVEIGIDEFGATALGALSVIKSAEEGKAVKRGGMIFEGSYGNKTVKFLSPVNGIVKSKNADIIGKKISNPYETWGVRLSSKDSLQNSDLFFTGNEALNWMKKEFLKLKIFTQNHSPKLELVGETMYDGGSLSDVRNNSLVDKSTNDFENEFLTL